MCARERAQKLRQHAFREILRRTKGNATVGVRSSNAEPSLALCFENSARVRHELLTGRGKRTSASVRGKQWHTHNLL